MTLQEYKDLRWVEIDLVTRELISKGFTFDGKTFSLSLTAQINWTNIPSLPDVLFPVHISTIDEQSYSLALVNKMNFYYTAINGKNAPLQSGNTLKAQIAAATTIEEASLIVDNRLEP